MVAKKAPRGPSRGSKTKRKNAPRVSAKRTNRRSVKAGTVQRVAFSDGRQGVRYPYAHLPKIGQHYLHNRYLHFAPNVPQSIMDAMMPKSESAAGSGDKQDLDEIMDVSKKFQTMQRQRKKLHAPSVSEVRDMLQHLVNFSSSKHEKEFQSLYPLLRSKKDGDVDLDQDDESADSKDNQRGVANVKNIKKFGEKLHRANPNIPAFRA